MKRSVVRRYVAFACCAVLAGALSGCGGSDAATGADKADSLTIGLPGIPPVFSSLLMYTAEEQGLYEAHDLDVTLRPFQTGTDATRAMQSGEIDVAFGPADLFVTVAAKDIPVVGIQGLDVLDWLVASSDPSVTSCEDLKGQTVGVDAVGGSRYLILQQILQSCGLTIDDVDTLAFPSAQSVQAMVAGQLTTSVLHLDELAAIEKQGVEADVVIEFRDVRPGGLYMILSTRKEALEAKRDAFVRLLAAHKEAADFINDPANHEASAKTAQFTGQDAETAGAALERFLEIHFWPVGQPGLTKDNVEGTIARQVGAGNIDQASAPAFEDIIDLSVWDDAVKVSK